ncbi:MAG: type II toxin-antitoxin system antitoxin SocA domain-containing protein [Dehalococcoidia bacterium]
MDGTTATAESVARYFLHLAATADEPTPLTQLQLHKLLYYAHAWSLASAGRPLYPARLQAWVHGPVDADLYPTFARYGSQAIGAHESADPSTLSKDDKRLIRSVWVAYGKFSAWRLREMTHEEAPWKDARASLPDEESSRAPITDEALRSFFYAQHDANCRAIGLTAEELAQARRDIREGRGIPLEQICAEILAEAEAAGIDRSLFRHPLKPVQPGAARRAG